MDRDGTINRDFGYVYEKGKLEFLPGALEALGRIRKAGFKLIIVTNQSGIGRGYFTLEQYYEFERFMAERMACGGAEVDGVYFCPHSPHEQCGCRKPKTGMYEQAARDFGIEWEKSYVIGDKERDLAVCRSRDIRGILYGSTRKEGNCTVGLAGWPEIAEYVLGRL